MNSRRPPGGINIYHYPAFGVAIGQRQNPPPVKRRHSARNSRSTGAEVGGHQEEQNYVKDNRPPCPNVRPLDSSDPATVLGSRKAEDLHGGENGSEAEGVGGHEGEFGGALVNLRVEIPGVPVEKATRKYRRVASPGAKGGARGLGNHSPTWDELSPRDAVPLVSAAKAAALAAAAAQERSQRAEVRGRPEWWGPRVKTSTQRMLRLRPAGLLPGGTSQQADGANQQDQGGVGETNGRRVREKNYKPESGRPVSPGAFLLEGIKVGTMNIPAGAQLLSVGGTSCKYVPFEEVLELVMSAGKDGDLVFDEV